MTYLPLRLNTLAELLFQALEPAEPELAKFFQWLEKPGWIFPALGKAGEIPPSPKASEDKLPAVRLLDFGKMERVF